MALKPVSGLMEPWTQMFPLFSFMHRFVTVSPAAYSPSTRLCKLQKKKVTQKWWSQVTCKTSLRPRPLWGV